MIEYLVERLHQSRLESPLARGVGPIGDAAAEHGTNPGVAQRLDHRAVDLGGRVRPHVLDDGRGARPQRLQTCRNSRRVCTLGCDGDRLLADRKQPLEQWRALGDAAHQ